MWGEKEKVSELIVIFPYSWFALLKRQSSYKNICLFKTGIFAFLPYSCGNSKIREKENWSIQIPRDKYRRLQL